MMLKKSVGGGDCDGLALGVVETVVCADIVDEEDTRAQDDEVEEHHQQAHPDDCSEEARTVVALRELTRVVLDELDLKSPRCIHSFQSEFASGI